MVLIWVSMTVSLPVSKFLDCTSFRFEFEFPYANLLKVLCINLPTSPFSKHQTFAHRPYYLSCIKIQILVLSVGSHSVVQAGLKLVIPFPEPHQC